MATIYKRNKYWWVAYKDKSGRRVQKSLKVTDGKNAKVLLKHYQAIEKAAFLEGTPLQHPILFDTWVQEYQTRRRNRVSPATVKKENLAIRSFRDHTKRRELIDVTNRDVEDWYSACLNTKAVATANCLLRHLKVFFEHAVQNNYLQVSPCKNIKFVKEAQKKVKVLSMQEVTSLLTILPGQWADLVQVALYTGARCGEICRLKIKDIDLASAEPNATIESTNENPTKSKKFRVVPLPKVSLQLFTRLTTDKNINKYLLLNPSGNPWKTAWIRRRFSKYCKEAKVSCTFHDLRRTYGAWLVMQGVDLVTVQENLGHSDISVTIKHYTHLVLQHRSQQTDRFPEIKT